MLQMFHADNAIVPKKNEIHKSRRLKADRHKFQMISQNQGL